MRLPTVPHSQGPLCSLWTSQWPSCFVCSSDCVSLVPTVLASRCDPVCVLVERALFPPGPPSRNTLALSCMNRYLISPQTHQWIAYPILCSLCLISQTSGRMHILMCIDVNLHDFYASHHRWTMPVLLCPVLLCPASMPSSNCFFTKYLHLYTIF